MRKTKEIISKIIESIAYAMRNVGSFFVFLYMFLMIAVFPFYLTNGYRNAGTDKSMLFRYIGIGLILSVVPCAIIYWLCSLKRSNETDVARKWNSMCVSDKFVLMYGLLVVVSYLCSKNKQEAFWGADGWFIGFATQMIYVVSYFCISRLAILKKVMILLMAVSTTVTFVLGILNRFSVYPLVLEGTNPSFIATLGNINWFCGYWSVFFPMAVGLLYMCIVNGGSIFLRLAAGIYLAICTATGAVQGSDSAMLVFVAVTLVLFCVSAKDINHRSAFYVVLMVMCGACQVIRVIRVIFPKAMNYDSATAELLTGGNLTLVLFVIMILLWMMINGGKLIGSKVTETQFLSYMKWERLVLLGVGVLGFVIFVVMIVRNTLYPGSIGALSDNPVFTFSEKWGSSRGITWTAGIKTFGDMSLGEKLIGLGPDSFAYGVYREGSSAAGMVRDVFGNSRLTNAHNEWITVLVNTGLLGLITYMGFFFSKAVRYISKGVSLPVAFACGLALVGYMSNNIFSFQQVLNGPFVFIVMGLGEAIVRKSESTP